MLEFWGFLKSYWFSVYIGIPEEIGSSSVGECLSDRIDELDTETNNEQVKSKISLLCPFMTDATEGVGQSYGGSFYLKWSKQENAYHACTAA